jgi:hypothetical protein
MMAARAVKRARRSAAKQAPTEPAPADGKSDAHADALVDLYLGRVEWLECLRGRDGPVRTGALDALRPGRVDVVRHGHLQMEW